MPDYSAYAVFSEWIVWLLGSGAFVVSVSALLLSIVRSTFARAAGRVVLVFVLATIAAGLVITHQRRADCDRNERNRTWAMQGGHVWHDERCPVEAFGSTVLSLELAALPLLVAVGALRRARGAKPSTPSRPHVVNLR